MSRPGPDVAALLAPYSRPVRLPSPSSCGDAHVARQLQRARQAARPSERLSALLSAAEYSFKKEQHALALNLFSASLSLSLSLPSSSLSSPASAASLATTLRRVGECHHALQDFPAAIAAFESALPLVSSSSSSSLSVQAERSLQALYLSLGNSFLESGDDEGATLRERRQFVLKAKAYHKLSVDSARKLCGIRQQPQQQQETEAKDEQADSRASAGRRKRKEGAMTSGGAQLLVRSYVNLANCLTQLLHFDGCEMQRRQRVAAAQASAAATDSSSSSCSPPTSPSSSPSSSSAFDAISSADDELPSLSSSALQSHRQARFSAAVSLLESAVALCVSHSLQSDLSTALENTAALYDTAGDAGKAKQYWLRQASEAGGGVAAEAEARLKVMMMQLRHERWDDALRTASRVRRLLQEAGDEEVEEALRLQATEETAWVQDVCDSIRRRDELQRDIAAMQEQNEAEEEEEEQELKDGRDAASKRRRMASAAAAGAGQPMRAAEDEEQHQQFRHPDSAQLQRVERLLRLLHAQVQLCLSLADSNIAAAAHQAMAFTAHQQAIAAVSSSPCCPPSVVASVHLYHCLSVARCLPGWALTQSSAAETRAALTSARQSLSAACLAGAGGMRHLLEAQLLFMAGQDGHRTLSLLRCGLQEVSGSEGGGGDDQRVLRAQLLLEMLQVLEVRQEEKEDGSDSQSWTEDKEKVTAELQDTQRWAERQPEEADRQRRWLQYGQFMLQPDNDDDDGDDENEDEQPLDACEAERQQAEDASMQDSLEAQPAAITFSHEQ